MYWGALFELQHPLFFAPKDFGMKVPLLRCRFSLGLQGLTTYQDPMISSPKHRSARRRYLRARSVGLIWDSPFGPLRFDYASPDEGYCHCP